MSITISGTDFDTFPKPVLSCIDTDFAIEAHVEARLSHHPNFADFRDFRYGVFQFQRQIRKMSCEDSEFAEVPQFSSDSSGSITL